MCGAYYSDDDAAKLEAGRHDVHQKYAELMRLFLLRVFKTDAATEHARHGFCRRLGTLTRAVDAVFDTLPPSLNAIPVRDQVVDATIDIQAFAVNVFGSLDNLTWILVHEKSVTADDGAPLQPRDVSLKNKNLRTKCSAEFHAYVDSHNEWFREMRQVRDSLVHRVPFFIPPFIVRPDALAEFERLETAAALASAARNYEQAEKLRADQEKLGCFRPWMVQSLTEETPLFQFLPQLISDYGLVHEFGGEVLKELDR